MTTRRYTEQQFRAAVDDPAVRTLADLCRALGLVPRGANYETLRAFADTLHLDIDQLLAWRRLDRTESELRDAVRDAASLDDVMRALHVKTEGQRRRTVLAQMRKLGLPELQIDPNRWLLPEPTGKARTSHDDDALLDALEDPGIDGYPALCAALNLQPSSTTYRRLRDRALLLGTALPAEWSKRGPRPHLYWAARSPETRLFPELAFRQAVAKSLSMADAIRAMNEEPTSGTYGRAARTVAEYRIDTSHLQPGEAGRQKRHVPDDDFFVAGILRAGSALKRRLITGGLREHHCARCGGTTWEGSPIPLEIDHIDGDRTNNQLENLRLMCPNCHALTPTYRGRNIGRATGGGTSSPSERRGSPRGSRQSP